MYHWPFYAAAGFLMFSILVTAYLGYCSRKYRGDSFARNFLLRVAPYAAVHLHELCAKLLIPFSTAVLVASVEIPLFVRYGFHARPRPPHFALHTLCWAGFIACFLASLRWNGLTEYKRVHFLFTHLQLLAAIGAFLLGIAIGRQM
ncbi:MAG: hypothetical protein KGJ13_04580 [Patescibacteria group bacterium]|nr:hypothetical protein [Patescibacteria group bacterium]